MATKTSYEVQIKQAGNWTICETFPGHEKDEALAVAKEIFEEQTKIQAVKVVKEVNDPDADTFSDSVIFRDERVVVITRKKDFKEKKKYARALTEKSSPGVKKGGKKESYGLSGFALRFMGGAVISLIIAGLCAAAAVMVLGGATVFDIYFVGNAKLGLAIGVFSLTFLISISVIAYRLIKKIKVKKSSKSSPSKSPQGQPSKSQMSLAAVAVHLVKGPFLLIYNAFAVLKHQGNLNKTASSGLAAPTGSVDKNPKETGEEPLSPVAEKLKTSLMDFLNQALDGGQADKNTMDNFNRFGVSLFLAGASEVLTTQGQIAPKSQIKILADCILVLRFKKSHALKLAERYEEYLMADSRYMKMFQAGRGAISVYLGDETLAPRLLDGALVEWNKPKALEKESGPITVMFANRAPSTEAPGAGDKGNGEHLRQIHSRIVEEALAAHAGMEVKRTPNGIMATFSKAPDAISAAIEMQKKTAISNQSDPSLVLHLKIGVNAGQSNAGETDLFGTVVRLAAQMVERASADQIFVLEMVKGFCDGADFKFLERGSFEMPAPDGVVKIYEVAWGHGDTEGAVADAPANP